MSGAERIYDIEGFTLAELPVFRDIVEERAAQNAKWGEQNHPDGTGRPYDQFHADKARRLCNDAAEAGVVTWRHILREEVAEALAESDPAKLREELIQVAAVAAAWVEAIDRRAA